MSSSWLARGTLALALLSGLYGCSNMVDPATGQLHGKSAEAMPSAESAPASEASSATADPAMSAAAAAEMDRLKRENQQLKVQQQESQARMDALTKQVAQEREEQRRFREMMTTNFDLLEQSVSKSLGDQMQRNQTAQAKTAVPPKTAVAGPAAVPPPAGEPAPAVAPAPVQGPQALEPLPYWDDKTSAPAKTLPPAPAKAEIKKPADAKPAPAAAGQVKPQAKAASPDSAAKSVQETGQDHRDKQAAVPLAAAAAVAAAAEAEPATFSDPDLQPPAKPREQTANPEAKPAYEKGFVYFAKGEYEESIRIYKDFLTRFPNDAHSDNAQFWIGEAHLQLKQIDQADNAFRQVLRNYAHKSTLEGYKTPDAIYKLGQISLQRNDRARAEYYFSNTAERFPETTAGQRAQRDLDQIRVNTAASGKLTPDS